MFEPESSDISSYSLDEDIDTHPAPFGANYKWTEEIIKQDLRIMKHDVTNKEYCVQIVPFKLPCYRPAVLHELLVLERVKGCRNVLQVIQSVEINFTMYIMFDTWHGTSLWTRCKAKGMHIEEAETKLIIKELSLALRDIHECGVIHGDIKPQNILCNNEDVLTRVALCNFGAAVFKKEQIQYMIGAPAYQAPEIVKHRYADDAHYNEPTDIWALGVCLYCILSGRLPFHGDCGRASCYRRKKLKRCASCLENMYEHIEANDWAMKGERWDRVSELGKSFIQRLIDPNPENRLTPEEIEQHQWTNAICKYFFVCLNLYQMHERAYT